MSLGRIAYRPVRRGDGHGGRDVVLGQGDRVGVVVLRQLEQHVQHLGRLVALRSDSIGVTISQDMN